eukprot:tig00000711_g3426.t1
MVHKSESTAHKAGPGHEHRIEFNLAVWITLTRIGLVPLLMLLRALGQYKSSALLFGVAGFTDFLDGFAARKLGMSTKFGAFLDPVADKLLVALSLISLIEEHPSPVVSVPCCIMIAREFAISAVREWMATVGKRDVVAVTWAGKWKTATQMGALFILLAIERRDALSDPAAQYGYWTGLVLFYSATVLAVYSAALYMGAAWRARKS